MCFTVLRQRIFIVYCKPHVRLKNKGALNSSIFLLVLMDYLNSPQQTEVVNVCPITRILIKAYEILLKSKITDLTSNSIFKLHNQDI